MEPHNAHVRAYSRHLYPVKHLVPFAFVLLSSLFGFLLGCLAVNSWLTVQCIWGS